MRMVTGRTDRVVVVGAGLGGLACALHLVGSGREVTILEREAVPGGRAGRLSVRGYEFDTGPTVLTVPDLVAEPLAAVGEDIADWLTLTRLDPAYRAYFPDGSTLDVIADPARLRPQPLAPGARCVHRPEPGHAGEPDPPGPAAPAPAGRLPPAG
jgi:phytoene desaturase